MSRREALAWSRHVGIARDVRAAATGFPLVEFLLGARYLDALEPPVIPLPGRASASSSSRALGRRPPSEAPA